MSDKIDSFQIPPNSEKQRIGDYLIGKSTFLPSRKSIKKAIKKNAILLNGVIATTGRWVQSGDLVELINTYEPPGKLYHTKLNIIFEDKQLALINKSGGMPTSGNFFRSVYNAIGVNLTIDPIEHFYPQPVHRLDSATCGLLLIAKTKTARIHLGMQFERNEVRKKYQALVHGKVTGSGIINIPIDNKSANTNFNLLSQHQIRNGEWISHLELIPESGRTHQLRKHCFYMGHPILGDKMYQRPGWQLRRKGLLLCATSLQFIHPENAKNMHFELEPPAKFGRILKKR